MVCEEYLDVINVVVRDAYKYTYPRPISAEGYIRSLDRHGAQPSYDEAWRQQVMERAFKRMVNKDKILTSKQTEWELDPDFDAKRFFKARNSADWVSQIYSTHTPELHRSRVALQSLESFLDCADLSPISGKQLIKLFGHSAGEEYDSLRNQDNKIVKPEPVPELVDLNHTSSMTSMKQKRIEIEIDSSDEQNASGSESSTPRPLFTPMSSPPSLQSARSSFEVDKPTDTTSTVAENPRDETATQSDIMAIERLGPEARVEAQPESTTVETPRQESHLGAHPVTMVEKSRREPSSAAQLERAIIEKPGQHSFRVAQPVRTTMDKPMSAASGGPLSEKADLERLISVHPWLPSAARRTQEKFPQESFEVVVSEGTLKFKCHDCPLNLYKAIYPDKNISNFEAHLRTPGHRRNVTARLGGIPHVIQQVSPAPSKSSKSRVSGVAAQPSPAGHRQSFNSRANTGQASPALPTSNSRPRINGMSQLVARLSTDYDQNGNPYPNKRGSLIIIFPVGCLLNAANARKRSRVPEPSHPVSEVSDNEDRTKRRRLDSEGYSAIPRTVKASARIANLDSPTKESGSSEGTCPVPAGSMRSARYVDAATDSPSSTTAEPLDGLGAPAKPNFGIALGNYRISQISEEVAASKAEQEALNTEFGHNKHHISDSEIESRTEADRELESQINASASSGVSNLTLAEKQASLSGLLSLLEKRTDTQRQNFTAAHQLQVSTSEEVSLLRTASNRYGQEIEAIKHSAKREKEWRRYFDKSTKEDRSKFARLEAKVSREREDKQNFKMSMEGRVDAMIKHHQISSDAVMKKMAALEKLVTEQSKQLEEQSKLIEVLTKHGAANRNEVTQIPRIEPKPTEEKERITLSNGGNKPPLRPAWARAK